MRNLPTEQRAIIQYDIIGEVISSDYDKYLVSLVTLIRRQMKQLNMLKPSLIPLKKNIPALTSIVKNQVFFNLSTKDTSLFRKSESSPGRP